MITIDPYRDSSPNARALALVANYGVASFDYGQAKLRAVRASSSEEVDACLLAREEARDALLTYIDILRELGESRVESLRQTLIAINPIDIHGPKDEHGQTKGGCERGTGSCPTCNGVGNLARPFDANCPAAWAHRFLMK